MPIPNLPNEILQDIVFHLVGKPDWCEEREYTSYAKGLARYACVSETWQCLVERYSFEDILLDNIRMVHAPSIINARRRKYVRTVRFVFAINVYSHTPLPQDPTTLYETDSDEGVAFTHFHNDLRNLFNYLASWPHAQIYDGGIALALSTYCPSDDEYSLHIEDWTYNVAALRSPPGREEALPTLDFITELRWNFESSMRDIREDEFREIMAAVPGITDVKWYAYIFKLGDVARGYQNVNGIITGLPDSVKTLAVGVEDDIFFETYKRRIRTRNNEPLDPLGGFLSEMSAFSSWIRIVSQGLEELYLLAVVSKEMFWPEISPPEDEEPSWPDLRQLCLHFYPLTPQQEMLFRAADPLAPSSMTHAEVETMQLAYVVPVHRHLNEFYFAVATALLHMPKIEVLRMQAYIQPSHHVFELQVDSRVNITWNSQEPFTPEERVLRLFERFAEGRHRELHVMYQRDRLELA